MKIWLDLRFLSNNLYSAFVIELVHWLIEQDKENTFIIYTNSNLEWFEFSNVNIKNVWIKNASLEEQFTYLNILKKDKNNLMLFFNHYKPVFYVWIYFTFLASLKDIYYNDFSNYIKKYSFLYILEKNIKKSSKIICFDKNTNEELIEKYNIEEKRIYTIDWFFPNSEYLANTENLKLDIRVKYNIKNNYFIYSGWEWVEKNYEKLIKVFKKLKDDWKKIDLIFLWDAIAKNILLRTVIINYEMQNNIHFMWVIKPAEKILFYKDSLWVIFPSFYEPFPFKLTEAIYFNTPIIASDLKNNKNIFWESIKYFSPISVNSIYENIKKFIETRKSKTKYEEIKEKYTKKNTINQLIEIIK